MDQELVSLDEEQNSEPSWEDIFLFGKYHMIGNMTSIGYDVITNGVTNMIPI